MPNDIPAAQAAWIDAENAWLEAYREAQRLRDKADQAKQAWVRANMNNESDKNEI